MLLFFQLPITDIRSFISGYTWKISAPPWPSPIFSSPNNKQDWFIRNFGKVKPRRKGGVPGWVGEDEICDAKNAIKINKIFPYINNKQKLHFQGIARHFYFDGYAVGKYELVFATTQANLLQPQKFKDLVNHFLNISVAPAYDKNLITPLFKAGDNLAKEYFLSTTKTKRLNGITGYWLKNFKSNWINSGSPVLFIECQNQEIEFPLSFEKDVQMKQISLPIEYNADLIHILLPVHDKLLRVWLLRRRNTIGNSEKLRALRLYIMRLNSEYESIKFVLLQIQSGKIKYKKGSKDNPLEAYFNETTRHISRMEKKTRSITETDDIEDLSKISFDKAYPGSADSILSKILNMRPQVFNKVEKIINKIYNIKGDYNKTMGDKIDFSGNFQGANINLKSDLKDVFINIQNANVLDQNTKKDIELLIQKLTDALNQLPSENKEDAEAVSSMAKNLIATAIKEKPNKKEVEISAEGLLKAGENISKAMPLVLVISKQLIEFVLNLISKK